MVPAADETKGVYSVCHLLSDAAQQRAQRLPRTEAAQWAVRMGQLVADTIPSPELDPEEDVAAYVRAKGVTRFVRQRSKLPGTPCETCVATQMLPMYVAPAVVALAQRLNCDPALAFRWASRICAIVLANPVTDHASTPTDALSALVMSEYAAEQRQVDCDLAE